MESHSGVATYMSWGSDIHVLGCGDIHASLMATYMSSRSISMEVVPANEVGST